jgi:hypothetical protein
MPYEEISEQVYLETKLKPLKINKVGEDSVGEQFCSNEICTRN